MSGGSPFRHLKTTWVQSWGLLQGTWPDVCWKRRRIDRSEGGHGHDKKPVRLRTLSCEAECNLQRPSLPGRVQVQGPKAGPNVESNLSLH